MGAAEDPGKVMLTASISLYEDDPVDAAILEWLDSLPRRKEDSGRGRVYRRGITKEFKQALYEYAKRHLRQSQPHSVVARRRSPDVEVAAPASHPSVGAPELVGAPDAGVPRSSLARETDRGDANPGGGDPVPRVRF